MSGLLKTGLQLVTNRFLHIKNHIKPVESSPSCSCSFSIFGPKTGLNRTFNTTDIGKRPKATIAQAVQPTHSREIMHHNGIITNLQNAIMMGLNNDRPLYIVFEKVESWDRQKTGLDQKLSRPIKTTTTVQSFI